MAMRKQILECIK